MTGQSSNQMPTPLRGNQMIKKVLPWVIGLIAVAILVFLGIKLFSVIFKPKFEVLSSPGSQGIVVYMPKSSVNQKNIDRVIASTKKDVEALNAKKTNKTIQTYYNLRAVDDKAAGLAVINQAKTMQDLSKLKPEEVRAKMQANQKSFNDHLVFNANSVNGWKIVYGQNYRSLQPKPVQPAQQPAKPALPVKK